MATKQKAAPAAPRSKAQAPSTRPAAKRPSSWRAEQERRRTVRMWTRIALLAVALGVVGVTTAVIVAGGSDPAPAADPADIELQLGDYFIAGDLEVPAGEVTVEAVNVGVQPHNVGIRRGPISTNINNGETTRFSLGELAPGDYELYCDIGDHVARGMVATLHVTEPVATTAATTG